MGPCEIQWPQAYNHQNHHALADVNAAVYCQRSIRFVNFLWDLSYPFHLCGEDPDLVCDLPNQCREWFWYTRSALFPLNRKSVGILGLSAVLICFVYLFIFIFFLFIFFSLKKDGFLSILYFEILEQSKTSFCITVFCCRGYIYESVHNISSSNKKVRLFHDSHLQAAQVGVGHIGRYFCMSDLYWEVWYLLLLSHNIPSAHCFFLTAFIWCDLFHLQKKLSWTK